MNTSTRDMIFAAIALGLAIAVGITSFQYSIGSSYFPRTLAILMGLLAMGFGLRTWLARQGAGKAPAEATAHLRSAAIALISVVAYVIGMILFGYEIATFVFLAALMRFLGTPGVVVPVGLAAVTTAILWGVFFVLLGASRPEALLF